MSRRQARETALQVLFQTDLLKDEQDSHNNVEKWAEEFALPASSIPFAKELVAGTLEHKAEFDNYLKDLSEDWSINRMPSVDRNLLRMACFELFYRADIPDKVTINEAVELAKQYGSEDSARFVNGILDQLAALAREKNFEVAQAKGQD